MNQQTIMNKVGFQGIGLHTGKNVSMTIFPSESDSGIFFKRVDLKPPQLIKVDINNVDGTLRGTTISSSGCKVHTVEHLLSALYALQIDNAIIEINNDEVPILDGSSKIFIDEILNIGIKTLDKKVEYIEIKEPIECISKNGNAKIAIYPHKSFKVTFLIDFKNKLIGEQSFTLHSIDDYIKEISNCRTFCTVDEIIRLRQNNLIKGGSNNNAIIFSEEQISQIEKDEIIEIFSPTNKNDDFLTTSKADLIFEDEPVRHKILDVIGDLYLLGKRINGHIISNKSGHALNVELVKKISQKYIQPNAINNKKFHFTKDEIKKIIPHRDPFLLIDEIIDGEDGKYVVSKKNVDNNEFYFKGHFPGRPIMPGVLILECMAQTSCFLDMKNTDNRNNKLMLLSIIKSAKFIKEVHPGDTLIIKTELIKYKMGTARVKGTGTVNGQIVATAEWMATLVNR